MEKKPLDQIFNFAPQQQAQLPGTKKPLDQIFDFSQPSQPATQESYSPLKEAAQPFIGAAKGLGSTFFGLAKIGQKIGNTIAKIPGLGFVKGDIGEKPKALSPTTTGQKIGFGAEQIAEFLVPGGAIAKGTKAVEVAAEASKLPKVARLGLKVATRAGLEGAGAAAVRGAQTGDLNEGKKAGGPVVAQRAA